MGSIPDDHVLFFIEVNSMIFLVLDVEQIPGCVQLSSQDLCSESQLSG